MPKLTKFELEPISDVDIYLFFEKGMRDVVSYISKIYSETNNKYLKSYDQNQESRHTIDWDTNNFYSYTMFKFLPTGRFKWRDHEEFDSNRYSSNSSSGCVLEVDLEYPKNLRELYNDCPLAPDKLEIKKEMSNY